MSLLDNVVQTKAWTTVLINSGRRLGKDRYHLGYAKPLLLDNFHALSYLQQFPVGSMVFQWTGHVWAQPKALYQDPATNPW